MRAQIQVNAVRREGGDELLQELSAAAASAGFSADAEYVHVGGESFHEVWTVVVVVAVTPFFTTFVSEAGKDAYAALKQLLGRTRDIGAAERAPEYVGRAVDDEPPADGICLIDSESGNRFFLEYDVETAAIEALPRVPRKREDVEDATIEALPGLPRKPEHTDWWWDGEEWVELPYLDSYILQHRPDPPSSRRLRLLISEERRRHPSTGAHS